MLLEKDKALSDKKEGIFFSHIFLIVIFPQQNNCTRFYWFFFMSLYSTSSCRPHTNRWISRMLRMSEVLNFYIFTKFIIIIYLYQNNWSGTKLLTSPCSHPSQSFKSHSTSLYNTILCWDLHHCLWNSTFTQLLSVHTFSGPALLHDVHLSNNLSLFYLQ